MRIQSLVPCQDGDAFVSSLCHPLDHDDVLRQPSSSLLPVALENGLRLISPKTWWGMIDFECKRGPMSQFDISTLAQSAKGLLLPLIFLLILRIVMVPKNQSSASFLAMLRKSQSDPTIPFFKLFIPIVASPWCLQCLYQLYYQLSMPLRTFRDMMGSPSLTLSRAIDVLTSRIIHRRAYRTPRYDVYLPPSLNTSTDGKPSNDQSALLLIPGATVSHEAYSEVAGRLSDEGFVVVVVSLEPFRLANPYFGTNLALAKRIMNEVTEKIHRVPENLVQSSDENKQLSQAKSIEWTLLGHSMGAFGAMQLFRAFADDPRDNLQKTSSTRNSTTSVSNKLVLWGLAAFIESATDLSHLKDAQILVLQGSNDALVELQRSRDKELVAFFPPTVVAETIAGGTHEGFSSYEPSFQLEDDAKKRPISLDEQQKQACEKTARFLRS